jgi:N-acetylglutamate synthase-like GNAT family acetyltransferase
MIYRAFIKTAPATSGVALLDGKVVGTISLLDLGDNQAALRKMFVKKQYRGPAFNAAGSLLAELLTWARGRNLKTIFLGTTPKFLAAHRFYEKNGFAEILKESLPDTFPVMTVDTKFYRYEV